MLNVDFEVFDKFIGEVVICVVCVDVFVIDEVIIVVDKVIDVMCEFVFYEW